MSAVYVVTSEHPEIHGTSLSVHSSLAGANTKAAELTNLIAERMNADIDQCDVHTATADSWEGILSNCQDYYGAQYCYVDVTECEVQS